MEKTKNKENARKKKVLVASVILAGLIVLGGTFAWFTASDTVTNKLTATGNYGTTITEDFTPVDNWTPGQKVNKDVYVVNTGNVDALVKVSLENAFTIYTENATATNPDDNQAEDTTYIALTDDEIEARESGGRLVIAYGEAASGFENIEDIVTPEGLSITITKTDGSTYVYVTGSINDDTEVKDTNGINATYDESTDEYKAYYAVATWLDADTNNAIKLANGLTLEFGTKIVSDANGESTTVKTVTVTKNTDTWSAEDVNTDSNSYTLAAASDNIGGTTANLFLFERTNGTATSDDSSTKFTGYYLGNDGVYKVNAVGLDTMSAKVTYATKEEVEDPTVIFVKGDDDSGYVTTTDDGTSYLTAKVTYGEGDSSSTIKVRIYLASNYEDYWQLVVGDDEVITFCYKDDLEEGATTKKLVDALELDSDSDTDYLEFEYDLNIVLDSVQVVVDEDGKETLTAANDEWKDEVTGTVRSYDTTDTGEIAVIEWTEVDNTVN